MGVYNHIAALPQALLPCTTLTSLRIREYGPTTSADLFLPHAARLREIELPPRMDVSEQVRLLSACPQLTSLSLEKPTLPIGVFSSLTNLRFLNFNFAKELADPVPYLRQLLTYCTRLQTLELAMAWPDPDSDLLALLHAAERANLRLLHVATGTQGQGYFNRLQSQFPWLDILLGGSKVLLQGTGGGGRRK